jgi:hypothetical protein
MSTEYEKQLEKRCEELEGQVEKMASEIEDMRAGRTKTTDLSLRHGNWTLVNVMHATEMKAAEFSRQIIIIAREEKTVSHLFKQPTKEITTNEYLYQEGAVGEKHTVYYLNQVGSPPTSERDMIICIIKKIKALGIVKELEKDEKFYMRIDEDKYKERFVRG